MQRARDEEKGRRERRYLPSSGVGRPDDTGSSEQEAEEAAQVKDKVDKGEEDDREKAVAENREALPNVKTGGVHTELTVRHGSLRLVMVARIETSIRFILQEEVNDYHEREASAHREAINISEVNFATQEEDRA